MSSCLTSLYTPAACTARGSDEFLSNLPLYTSCLHAQRGGGMSSCLTSLYTPAACLHSEGVGWVLVYIHQLPAARGWDEFLSNLPLYTSCLHAQRGGGMSSCLTSLYTPAACMHSEGVGWVQPPSIHQLPACTARGWDEFLSNLPLYTSCLHAQRGGGMSSCLPSLYTPAACTARGSDEFLSNLPLYTSCLHAQRGGGMSSCLTSLYTPAACTARGSCLTSLCTPAACTARGSDDEFLSNLPLYTSCLHSEGVGWVLV